MMSGVHNSVANSWINGPSIQVGSVCGSITVALDRPDYQVQWLQPSPAPAYIPARQRTPSRLLDTRREVVPYRRRPAEEQRLLDWLDDPAVPTSVLLVHGAGGRGKTRLANALATHSHVSGWAVAHALGRLTDKPSMLAGEAQPPPQQGVLVVVDYAERWATDTLITLVTDLARTYSGRPVRVLLLARSTQDLWTQLCDHLDRDPIELPDPVELRDLTTSAEDREHAFVQAATAFQAALDLADGPATPPADLAHQDYASPLVLHMAALAAVCANRDHETSPDRADLSDYLLRHERRYWPPAATAPNSVFLATLFGPLSDDAAVDLLRRAELADGAAAARELLHWHDGLYPDHDAGSGLHEPALAPLRPDRFGEDFIADHLKADSRNKSVLSRLATESAVDAAAWRRCLIVLAATADRHPHVRTVLWALLVSHSHLGAHSSAPLIRTVITHAPFAVAEAFGRSLPDYRTDLLRPSADLAQYVVTAFPDTGSMALRAYVLDVLCKRLWHVGDRRGALVAAHDTVRISRALAEVDPTARPNFAASLNNLANQLSQSGNYHSALGIAREAVSAYRELAKTGDDAPISGGLAMSLNNLANQLAATGDHGTALTTAREAVSAYRQLARTDPAARPNLAMSLNNLALRLGETGDHHGALAAIRKALKMRRALAEADPGAHLPGLAGSLTNFAFQLARAGDRQGALAAADEAVRTLRLLTEAEPDAYLSDLAWALATFAWVQTFDDTSPVPQAAWPAVEESLAIYQRVSATQPVTGNHLHALDLAHRLLERLGRADEIPGLRIGRE